MFSYFVNNWREWPIQNGIVLVLLFVLGIIIWRMSRREYWRLAYHEVCARKSAVVCFFILCFYALIAVLDSVGYTSQRINPETGDTITVSASCFDYLTAFINTKDEVTYSAPFADSQFTAETVVFPDGTTKRVYPDLKYKNWHVMGTDRVGKDVLYQGMKSIRTGMIIGLVTTLLAIPFAIFMGVCAGYFGGRVDDAIQYVYTVMSSIPTVLFIAAFILVFGPGLLQLCVAMGIASWTSLCRLLRGETLKLREMEYIQAAKAMGVPSFSIVRRHVVPNIMHLVLISAVLAFSGQVLAEAALTYLGIGVGADTMSWGSMINDARTELTRDPIVWWKLVTAFVLMLGLVLPANIFGDAVRDALDPRLRTQ